MHPEYSFPLYRVPFFLESDYHTRPDDFTETHSERMIRKFGSMENFVAFRQWHDLPGRGAEVNLDSVGFVQSNLSKRIQSSTVKSHRLVQYITLKHGVGAAESFYEKLNVEHFVRSGILNDREMLLRLAGEVGIAGSDMER